MSDLAYPPQRPLTVSEVLDLTFKIYRATFVNCLLLSGIGAIAAQLGAIFQLLRGRGALPTPHDLQGLLALLHDPAIGVVGFLDLVSALLSIVFYGAVLLRQDTLLGGRTAGGEFLLALRRAGGVIGLLLLGTLCAGVCLAPSGLAFLPAFGLGAKFVLVLVSIVALCYLVVAISSSYAILFAEHAGPIRSLTRSWNLTAGNFWRLSVIYTVAFVLLMVAYMLIGAVAAFIGGIFGRADLAVVAALVGVVGVAMGALVTPFYTAMGLAVLGDLKTRKEGADLERRIAAAT